MEIIKKGNKPPKILRKVQFKCVWCGSILKADKEELQKDTVDFDEQFYRFHCPVCEEERIVSECDIEPMR